MHFGGGGFGSKTFFYAIEIFAKAVEIIAVIFQLLSILEKPEKVSARKIKEVNKLDQTLKEMVSLLVIVVQYLHNTFFYNQ